MRMSHRRAIYKGGGIPPVPTSWMTHAVVAATGSWSPTVAGWYQFYVIGKGGDGADGYRRNSTSGTVVNQVRSGGGGGTGGVAIHLLYLLPGDSVSIAIEDSQTTLSYGGQTVTATSGGDGGIGADNRTGGAGGTADGGNVANIAGVQGEDGIYGASTSQYENVTRSGGGGGIPTEAMKYVESAPTPTSVGDGADAPYSTSVSSPQLGGGAAGGGAASRGSAYAGGTGASGGVVVESKMVINIG